MRDPRLDSLLERLRQRREYRGAALYGSRARGDARDDSDYDVLVLMDEAFGQELVAEDGTFDLILASEQKMRAFVAAHPDDAIETWRVATILDDPTGVLGRLREDTLERERQGKDPLSEADLRTREFNIVDKLRAAEHALAADPPTAGLLVSLIMNDLTALAFDRRGEWTPGPKQRLPKLRKLDPELGTVADRVLTGSTLRARVAAARSLAELVLGH